MKELLLVALVRLLQISKPTALGRPRALASLRGLEILSKARYLGSFGSKEVGMKQVPNNGLCWECGIDHCGRDTKDFADYTTEEHTWKGKFQTVDCDGCGRIKVNHRGIRMHYLNEKEEK